MLFRSSDPSLLDMLPEDFLNVDLETDTDTEKEVNLETEIGEKDGYGYQSRRRRRATANEVNLETEIGEKDDESVSGSKRRRRTAITKVACIDDDKASFGDGAGNCPNLRERKTNGVDVSSNCNAQAGSYCRKTCSKC